MKFPSTMRLKIFPRRKDVLIASIIWFILLAFAPFAPNEGPPNLFFMLIRIPSFVVYLFQNPTRFPSEASIFIFIFIWTIAYALIAWLLGWLVAGCIYAIKALLKGESTQEKDASETGSQGVLNTKLIFLPLVLDGVSIFSALIAALMLSRIYHYIECIELYRGCATTLDADSIQIDHMALILAVAMFIAGGGYYKVRPRMDRIDKWIIICSLAISGGCILTWIIIGQINL